MWSNWSDGVAGNVKQWDLFRKNIIRFLLKEKIASNNALPDIYSRDTKNALPRATYEIFTAVSFILAKTGNTRCPLMMDKQTLGQSHNRTLLINKKGKTTNTCNNTHKSQKHAE